ncbi:MAG: hypothetical protein K2L28_06200 [Muribaculaceae bacterium]|nr:hypothetical protein [Muribaculaceae bacterium]
MNIIPKSPEGVLRLQAAFNPVISPQGVCGAQRHSFPIGNKLIERAIQSAGGASFLQPAAKLADCALPFESVASRGARAATQPRRHRLAEASAKILLPKIVEFYIFE